MKSDSPTSEPELSSPGFPKAETESTMKFISSIGNSAVPRNEAERISLMRSERPTAHPHLAVDADSLGTPVPFGELREGDSVVAIGHSEIASGFISHMASESDGLQLILEDRKHPKIYPQLTWIHGVISVFRVEPRSATREPNRLARFFGAQPESYPLAPTISEIFDQPMGIERISIEDQGRPIILEEHSGYRWSTHLILSVERSGYSFRATFGDPGISGIYTSTLAQTISARIFR